MSDNIKSNLTNFIVSQVDKSLLLSLDEAIRAAYSKANKRAKEDFKHIKHSRPRAQLRRYMIDDAFIGAMQNFNPVEMTTVPLGENYVVLASGYITLSHIELHENKWARPAKHRAFLARRNSILEPVNLDFFKETPPSLAESLHIVAVVLHPNPKSKEQGRPKEILITVPYTNWKGYHLELPLRELLLKYNESTVQQETIDSAWPKLKRNLKQREQSE